MARLASAVAFPILAPIVPCGVASDEVCPLAAPPAAAGESCLGLAVIISGAGAIAGIPGNDV